MNDDNEVYEYELGGQRGLCLGSLLQGLLDIGATVIGISKRENMEDGEFSNHQDND